MRKKVNAKSHSSGKVAAGTKLTGSIIKMIPQYNSSSSELSCEAASHKLDGNNDQRATKSNVHRTKDDTDPERKRERERERERESQLLLTLQHSSLTRLHMRL